ncbi:MAG TPA: glutaredoxin family protein [Burkholderiaceae bacterium]|nr:glutaredoxin family protein [Burkholderiaceae bacterium]
MRTFARLIRCSPLVLLAAWAPAHALYKVVGPDGKVTYTDRPPAESRAQALGASGAPVEGGSALPFELRQIASRFPVTLYTTTNCQPCDAGRALLRQRGIPHAEKTVTTPEDSQAFASMTGSNQLPLVQIGQQQVRGFSSTEWSSYLDAAGYPKQSRLPPNFQFPAATPLVEAKAAPAAQPPQPSEPAPAAPATPSAPPPAAGNAPPGFKF